MRLLALTLALSVVSITSYAQDIPRVLSSDEQVAQAQTPAACAPYAEFAALLASDYNETPVARGMSNRGFIVEIFATADGSTFTVLGVQPNGTACGLAAGEGFEIVNAAETPVPGTDS